MTEENIVEIKRLVLAIADASKTAWDAEARRKEAYCKLDQYLYAIKANPLLVKA